jgi:hypothetical protein
MYFPNESKPRKGKYPMDLLKTIRERRSARAFQPVSIPGETIEAILRLTINAPSANNLQPWEFVVVRDEEKDRLSRRFIQSILLFCQIWLEFSQLKGIVRKTEPFLFALA